MQPAVANYFKPSVDIPARWLQVRFSAHSNSESKQLSTCKAPLTQQSHFLVQRDELTGKAGSSRTGGKQAAEGRVCPICCSV